jgi:hypothetical protein
LKRKGKKEEETKNIVVMPEPPPDNVLRFPWSNFILITKY